MDHDSNLEYSIYCKLRVIHISLMESTFNRLIHYRDTNTLDLTNPDIRSMLIELVEYYESSQWKDDYAADERGELPPELKRGVLSQDGVYNLLTDIFPEGTPKWVYEGQIYGI